MFVPATSWLSAALTAINAALFNHASATYAVHLGQAPFAPTPTSTPSSFTEADYTGYAALTVDGFVGPYVGSLGYPEQIPVSVISFTPTGTTVANSIGGYWIVDSLGNYVGGEAFSTPIELSGPTTTLSFTPIIQQVPWATNVIVVP
jgi:hypothetical protein